MYVSTRKLGAYVRVPGRPARFFSYSKFGKTLAVVKARQLAAKHTDKTRANPANGRRVLGGGVYRIVRAGRPRWVAQWNHKVGVAKHKEFSVKKYGEAGAKQKAKAHRQLMVKELLAA
jgi:hypothetical protein